MRTWRKSFTFFLVQKKEKNMATTNLIPVHTGKDGSIIKTLRRVIGYVENPDKTEKGDLITCYQCDLRTAAEEFALDRRKYAVRSGRGLHRNDVAAYHMRQSFKPGEITPEEANRLGNELAMHFTKGKHAYIVATHTDRKHLHRKPLPPGRSACNSNPRWL